MADGGTQVKQILAAIPDGNDQLKQALTAAQSQAEDQGLDDAGVAAAMVQAAQMQGFVFTQGQFLPRIQQQQSMQPPPQQRPPAAAPAAHPPQQMAFGQPPMQQQPPHQVQQPPPAQQIPGQQKPPFPQKPYGYALDTKDINNVEIWSTGTFNGDTYTEKDLQDMVDAQNEIGSEVKPYIKLGHDNGQGLLQADGYPAAGWITNVRRVGSKLYADFKNVPGKIAELIDAKAYGRFSPEIYWNLKTTAGKIYRRVLSSVALLGAGTPANPTLNDFISLYSTDADLRAYHVMKESNMDEQKLKQLEEENAKLKASLEAESKKYSQASEDLKRIESEKFAGEVDAAWKKYAAKKLLPKLEHVFKAIAFSDRSDAKVYSFKDGETEKKLEYVSAFDLACKFADAMPEMSFSQKTLYSDPLELKAAGIDGVDDEILDRRAKAYREDQGKAGRKISYSQAVKEVSAQGVN